MKEPLAWQDDVTSPSQLPLVSGCKTVVSDQTWVVASQIYGGHLVIYSKGRYFDCPSWPGKHVDGIALNMAAMVAIHSWTLLTVNQPKPQTKQQPQQQPQPQPQHLNQPQPQPQPAFSFYGSFSFYP